MGILDGKVALVTGAGRGIGREHALMMASEGAKVVVNDLGGDAAGGGADATPAQEVVAEIEAMGGEAVVNGGNVAKFDEAGAMIQQAIDTFGDINIVVNNAGILRDRMLFSMSEDDWDAVIAVHLKGTFGPSNHAAKYWREQAKAGNDVYGRIINTASPPIRSAVMRDHAVGARQLTVTPYFTSSCAAMIENAAIPALAAP